MAKRGQPHENNGMNDGALSKGNGGASCDDLFGLIKGLADLLDHPAMPAPYQKHCCHSQLGNQVGSQDDCDAREECRVQPKGTLHVRESCADRKMFCR